MYPAAPVTQHTLLVISPFINVSFVVLPHIKLVAALFVAIAALLLGQLVSTYAPQKFFDTIFAPSKFQLIFSCMRLCCRGRAFPVIVNVGS